MQFTKSTQHPEPTGKVSKPKYVKIFVGLHTYAEHNSLKKIFPK